MSIKFDTNPVLLADPSNTHKDLESAHRLVVLVPADADFRAAMQRIWELAQATHMRVQLLSLCKDTSEEPRLRRELATVASLLLQDGETCAEIKIDIGTNWVEALKFNYKAGDMIVCFAEQSTGLLRRPLSQILEENFNATVYILPDTTPQPSHPKRLSQINTWLGFILVIIGFGLLQAKLIQLPAGWLQNSLLILSLIPEFWLIWVWDGLSR